MEHKKKIWLGIAGVLAAAICFWFYAAHFQRQAAPDSAADLSASDVGLIELKKVMKAHPEYEKLETLRKELNTLLAIKDSISEAAFSDSEQAKSDPAAIADAIEQKQSQIASMADDNDERSLRHQQMVYRQQFEEELAGEVEEINNAYLPTSFNLRLKLENVRMKDEERKAMEEQYLNNESERKQKIAEKQTALLAKYQQLLQQKHQENIAASQERRSQQAQERTVQAGEQSAAIDEKNAELKSQAVKNKKFSDGEAIDNENEIERKQQEIAALERKILDDIASKAGKIAAEQKLSVVIAAKNFVNIQAVDITELVINEIKR